MASGERAEDEAADIERLKKLLQKNDELTGALIDHMGTMTNRLQRIENDIATLQQSSSRLWVVQRNLDRTLEAAYQIEQIVHVADFKQETIYRGPINGVDVYLKELEAIDGALDFLQSNVTVSSSSSNLQRLRLLHAEGISQLDKRFSAALREISVPLDDWRGVLTQDLNQQDGCCLVPATSMKELKLLVSRLCTSAGSKYKGEFRNYRANFVIGSMSRAHPEGAVAPSATYADAPAASSAAKSHPYSELIQLLYVLVHHEKHFAFTILGEVHGESAFAKIIQVPVQVVVKAGDEMLKSYSAIGLATASSFALFVIFRLIARLMRSFKRLMTGAAIPSYQQLQDFSNRLHSVCQSVFQELESSVKKSHTRLIPEDGNVDQLTSRTVQFVRQMVQQDDFVVSLLPDEYRAKGSTAIVFFIQSVLGFLCDNLKQRNSSSGGGGERSGGSDKSDTATLQCIFLINNYHHLMTGMKGTEAETMVGKSFFRRLGKEIETLKAQFRASWNKCIESVVDHHVVTSSASSGKKSSKKQENRDKSYSQIKAAFSAFNTRLEHLFQSQKAYVVPDDNLKREIRHDVSSVLLPLYTQFFDKYNEVPFAKQRHKYVKYSPNTLEAMLSHVLEGEVDAHSQGGKLRAALFRNTQQ